MDTLTATIQEQKMNEVPINIRMAARLAAGAIRRIKEKNRENGLDKEHHERLIDTTAKGAYNEQVKAK
jgi:hypothetical protein